MKERNILAIVIIALLLITAGYLAATNLNIMPTEAATRAVLVDQLAGFLVGVATVVFLLVEGALIYAVIKFRRRKGDESDAVPNYGNTTLEIIWTAIPAIIVVVISVYSFRVLTAIEEPSEDEMVVEVIGRQFVWLFQYPEYGISSQELHLIIDQPVRFEITSEDVIHSFWIPEFRAKRDATPGQISDLRVTPTKVGVYPIRCAELCGPGHAAMNTVAIVESEEEFQAWLEQMIAPSETVDDEVIEVVQLVGRDIFTLQGCGACHILSDAGMTGVVGPSLDGIGARAGGMISGISARQYILKSITAPDSFIVEGYPTGVMPTDVGERLTEEELDTLVDYLLEQ
ncbi:MAG: cytochrome c oxidase subunit II [Anaerolineales bacterium]|nr:cytochrome c oxidase subunit II [Anaerolineales bacterium]